VTAAGRVRDNALLLFIVAASACAPEPVPSSPPGSPLPDLTPAQTAAFQAGKALFLHRFTEQEGLGPAFNDDECSACHDLPAPGGAGADRVTKATRFEGGRCDLLIDAGGDLLQSQTTSALRQRGVLAEPVPVRANAVAQIAPPPLLGLGALAAIPDHEILLRADPDDSDRDGISGRAGVALNGGLGRFGRKATFATIRDFVASALSGEMGITTKHFAEQGVAGAALPPGSDPHPDPELSEAALDQLTAFVALLAPPAPLELNLAARDSVDRGEEVFMAIGCGACHTPTMRTGASPVAALANRKYRLFSDLLLHDLGPELASVCSPDAGPSEWRTAPLIGLRFRPFLLHQGQAHSIDQAIRLHGGEAEKMRLRYEALAPHQQALLLRFVSAL
jgi:CxxC motif-containing protein (DUF1111 family)